MAALALARQTCATSGFFQPNLSSVCSGLFQVAQEEVGNILAFFIPSVACIVQVGAGPHWGFRRLQAGA